MVGSGEKDIYLHFAQLPLSPYHLTLSLIFSSLSSAATLVNLNGSLACDEAVSPRVLTAFGHSSAVIATALGVGVTMSMSAPVYGMTLAWALAACADGMKKRKAAHSEKDEKVLGKAAIVQSKLCWAGSLACGATALYTALM